jgi:hypothetical protein
MAEYKFITHWKLDAPLPEIWDVISDASKWPEWWKGVLKVKVLSDGSDGKIRFAHTWRSFIPYKLKFITSVIEINPLKNITAKATGELEGTGEWEFKESNGGTTVTYYWFVRTNRMWMKLTAPLLSWLFRWNHDTVMRWGGEGLAKKLKCNIRFSSEWLR